MQTKQTTLKSFIVHDSSDSGDPDSEYEEADAPLRKSEIMSWTKVKARDQMRNERQPVYSINEDLAALLRNKQYTKQAADAERHYLFDVDDYEQNSPQLILQNYQLTPEVLRGQGVVASNLRAQLVEKAKRLLGIDLHDDNLDDAVLNHMPRALRRSYIPKR